MRMATQASSSAAPYRSYMAPNVNGLDLLVELAHQLLVLLVAEVLNSALLYPRTAGAVERNLDAQLVLQMPQLEAHFIVCALWLGRLRLHARKSIRMGKRPERCQLTVCA